MGHKVKPVGMRIGVNRDWNSRWYAADKEFPVYLDDYGMDEFIEIQIGEEYRQISLRYDWYYELDKQFDLERFILTNTKEGYQELLDELESSSWYQKLF